MYSKRVWLNKEASPSTSSIIAFDDDVNYNGEIVRSTFLKISDCHSIIKLHVAEYDTIDDFITKMELLKTEIELFVEHLKYNYEQRNHVPYD